jgi:hypothetical protein
VRNATLLIACSLSLAWAGVAAAQSEEPEEQPQEGAEGITAEQAAETDEPPPEEVLQATEETSETLAEPQLAESDVEAEETEQTAEAAPEEEEEAPAPPPDLPFRNSFFDWTNSVTFNTFIRDAQLAYNPYYAQSFSLTPRWYLAPTSYFLVNQSLGVELTPSDFDASLRDPQLTDTIVEFRQIIPWEGFAFMGQLRLTLPTSKASQAAQRYLSTGLGVQVVRPIPEAFLTVAGSFAYRRWWAGSNVPQSGVDQQIHTGEGLHGCGVTPVSGLDGPPDGCDQVSALSTTRDTIVTGITTTFSYENFAATFQFLFINLYGHPLAPARIDVDTSEEPLIIEDESNHWRNFIYMTLALSYQFAPWFSMTLGVANAGVFAPAYDGRGNVQSPFNPDTQVYLSTTIQLDALYTEIAGGEEDGLTPEERQRRRQGLSALPPIGGAM